MKLTILSTTLTFALACAQGSTSQWKPPGPDDCMWLQDIHPIPQNRVTQVVNIMQFEALVP